LKHQAGRPGICRVIGPIVAAALLSAGLSVAAFAAESTFEANVAGHKAPFKIGVSNGYIGNTWRAQYVGDIEEVAKELRKDGDIASITILNSNSGIAGQLTQLNSLITSGVDALVINPESNDAMKPIIARVVASGILVVISDNPLGIPGVLSVYLDQNMFAKVGTQWLVDELHGVGDVVSIDGVAGVTGNELRKQYRDEVLAKYPGIKLIASVPGNWDEAKAREVMGSLLAAHDKIDGVLSQDVMSQGIVRAFDAAGRKLVPMDGDYVKSFLKVWQSRPDIKAAVVTNPPGNGADAVRMTVALLRGKHINQSLLQPNQTDPKVVNAVVIPEPIVVTREAEKNKPWCTESTECISLDEALSRLASQPDSTALDSVMTQQEVEDRYFLK
jgi:ribose transport system substrate-binding protein